MPKVAQSSDNSGFKFKKDLDYALSAPKSNENFNQLLFRIFLKADNDSLTALNKAFPDHAKTFHAYKTFGCIIFDDYEIKG